jgi:hypothetical protein
LLNENDSDAIVYDNKLGPGFGYHDLTICNSCNQNFESESNLGSVYNFTGAENVNKREGGVYLAGNIHFKVEEYEVFKVEF